MVFLWTNVVETGPVSTAPDCLRLRVLELNAAAIISRLNDDSFWTSGRKREGTNIGEWHWCSWRTAEHYKEIGTTKEGKTKSRISKSRCKFLWYIYIYIVKKHDNIYIYIYLSMSVCLYVCMSACLHVCMSACLHVCMSACLHVCMSACLHVCMSACLHVCMSACLHVCMSACQHVSMYACMYVCMHACMYVCMYLSGRYYTSLLVPLVPATAMHQISTANYFSTARGKFVSEHASIQPCSTGGSNERVPTCKRIVLVDRKEYPIRSSVLQMGLLLDWLETRRTRVHTTRCNFRWL